MAAVPVTVLAVPYTEKENVAVYEICFRDF
jgi:hypothetical protein